MNFEFQAMHDYFGDVPTDCYKNVWGDVQALVDALFVDAVDAGWSGRWLMLYDTGSILGFSGQISSQPHTSFGPPKGS